jgi:hypothetical protein
MVLQYTIQWRYIAQWCAILLDHIGPTVFVHRNLILYLAFLLRLVIDSAAEGVFGAAIGRKERKQVSANV